MYEKRLLYNQKKQLELNRHVLQRGENIEVLVMGHWLPGHVEEDASGWYLLTFDGAGIRLHVGLIARFMEPSFIDPHSSREDAAAQPSQQPEKSEEKRR